MLLVHEWQVLLIERPKTNMIELEVATRLKPHFWRQYIVYTNGAAHESQPVKSRKSGRSLRQGGSLLKSAPAASAPARTTGTLTCRLPSLPPHPYFLQQSNKQHVKELHRSMIVSTNQNGGPKQLNTWPIADLAATVDSTQLTKSSRNFLQSRPNSLFRWELPSFSRADDTRVPARKRSSSMAANFE